MQRCRGLGRTSFSPFRWSSFSQPEDFLTRGAVTLLLSNFPSALPSCSCLHCDTLASPVQSYLFPLQANRGLVAGTPASSRRKIPIWWQRHGILFAKVSREDARGCQKRINNRPLAYLYFVLCTCTLTTPPSKDVCFHIPSLTTYAVLVKCMRWTKNQSGEREGGGGKRR